MLRILCLHGKQQNRSSFRTKLGRLPSKLKNYANLTIIDAPNECEMHTSPGSSNAVTDEDPTNGSGNIESGNVGKSWYNRNEQGEIENESLNNSINYLQEVWLKDGPFDGILGFSMGGTIATLMCSDKYQTLFPGINFVICIGAPHVSPMLDDCSIPTSIRSLHIAGEADSIVSKDRSITLANLYHEPKMFFHPLGHCIPMKAEYLGWFTEFVEALHQAKI